MGVTITIKNVSEGVNYSLMSMAKNKGMSRQEFLSRQLESIAVSGQVSDAEERYRSLVLILLEKIKDMEEIIEKNNMVLQDVIDVLNERN